MYFQYCALPGKAGHRRSLSGRAAVRQSMVVWLQCWPVYVLSMKPYFCVMVHLGTAGWLLLRLCRWYWSGPARWGLLCYCYSALCSITPSGAGPPSAGDWVSTPGYLIGKIHIWMSWYAPWHVTHSNSWKKVKGLKTQKVLIILKALFPNIRILLSPVYYSFLWHWM